MPCTLVTVSGKCIYALHTRYSLRQMHSTLVRQANEISKRGVYRDVNKERRQDRGEIACMANDFVYCVLLQNCPAIT